MRFMRKGVFTLALLALLPTAAAADEFCESASTDCRARLLAYINRETIRIDAGFEEMTDGMVIDAVIARFKAGVPVRLLVEPRRTTQVPSNGPALDKLRLAGIPMRKKTSGSMLHWKMMVFTGQNVVEFAAANFTQSYLVPVVPFKNFTQDPLFFSTNTALVQSFQRKFDDVWSDVTNFTNYANVTTPARAYPLYPIDASLNFVPTQNFATRSKPLYDAETQQIDVTMYKITEPTLTDALIRAVKRGVPVRLIVEPDRYRNTANVWQAYNVDRMYAAGVKIRERAHLGFLHQKTTLLYAQHRTIFGSSNWTAESNQSQYEHNYFATDLMFFNWFQQVFVRKWGSAETRAFVPQPPQVPAYVAPANTAFGQPTTITLSWKPGLWAHRADVYLGTTSSPALFKSGVVVSPNTTAKLTVTGLAPGATYFWRVVSKTMAGKTATGPTWSFGVAP